MSHRTFALILIPALIAAGCGEDSGQLKLQRLLEDSMGPSPKDLVNQLGSEDPDLRRDAIERLSREDWGREGPFPKTYAAFAQDEDHTVRSAALRALARCGTSEYIKDVIDALEDREPSVRWDAAAALDSLFHADAIAPLSRSATSDRSSQVRVAAARALRHYHRADVLEMLLLCLNDRDLAVRHQAGESLSELTGEDAGTDPLAWVRVLSAKADPFEPPARPKKSWWQKLRLGKKRPTSTTAPATSPAL